MVQDQGLAAQSAQQPQQGGNLQGAVPSIEEIVALLMQGIPPEELVQMGVPEEMIMEAISLLEQQLAQQGAAQSSPDQGLAAQSAAQPGVV